MTKKRRFWFLFLLAAIFLGGGGYFYYQQVTAVTAQTTAQPAVQTAVVRRGDLIISATGSGTIIAADEIQIGFNSNGTLKTLSVQVGDKVSLGDVLAQIDDTNAQTALANAQLQLAQIAMKTDASATQTGISFNAISVEQAQINLDEAQSTLDDLLNWTPDADAIALLQTKVDSAQASYNAARGQEAATGTSISIKGISLDQAQRDLDTAQTAYNVAYDPGRDWELGDPHRADALTAERSRADSSLQRAQENLQIAQLNYNAAVASTNNSSSTNAESNLLSAQQALAAAQVGPTEAEITAAETAVHKAQLALQQAQLNQESDGLNLQQAQLNVASAQADVDGTTLVAPMNGTIMAVNAHVGEQAGAALLSLADLSQPMLEIFIDESDLDKINVGYNVNVTFEALPDETFTGEVTQIDPQLYQSGGVSAVHATVRLHYAKPQTLPVGLNATVEVVSGQAQNALLVPVEALREIAPGQYALFVVEADGTLKLHTVEVGLMDFTSAEILSGVNEGDTVTTGLVETQ